MCKSASLLVVQAYFAPTLVIGHHMNRIFCIHIGDWTTHEVSTPPSIGVQAQHQKHRKCPGQADTVDTSSTTHGLPITHITTSTITVLNGWASCNLQQIAADTESTSKHHDNRYVPGSGGGGGNPSGGRVTDAAGGGGGGTRGG